MFEYVVLQVNKEANVKNWKLYNYNTKTAYRLNEVNLKPNDRLIVSSSRSPIGRSFRVNKCDGFYTQFKNFKPTVKSNCPDGIDILRDGKYRVSDLNCIQHIKKIQKCEVGISDRKDVSKNCNNFIQTKLNRSTCFDLYKTDDDFETNEVRTFLNSEKEIWSIKRANGILLLDDENKIVSSFVY